MRSFQLEDIRLVTNYFKAHPSTAALIQEIILNNNGIGDAGAQVLAKGLQHCTNLQNLHVSGNNLTDKCIPCLIELINSAGNLESLHRLYIGNWFTPEGKEQIEEAMRGRNSIGDSEMSDTLSSDDLGNLKLALTEFLKKLPSEGVNIKTAKSGQLTKKEVVEWLEDIGQHHYASLLRKSGGIQRVLRETKKRVHEKYLKICGGEKILPVFKIILCGVPRSGKTLFWKNLVKKYEENQSDSRPESENASNDSEISVSTKCAEPHYMLVTLADWYLCKEECDGITEETYEIYTKILEKFSEQANQSQTSSEGTLPEQQNHSKSGVQVILSEKHSMPFERNQAPSATPHISHSTSPTSDTSAHSISHPQSDAIPDPPANFLISSDKEPDSKKSEIYDLIDSIFKALEESEHDSSTLKRVHIVINLIDTGGQSAFLHLLPLVTVGNALYLIFFSYEHHLEMPLKDKFVGEIKTFNLNHKFTQIDVILQVLRCVSTIEEKKTKNKRSEHMVKALLVGTHKDEPHNQMDKDNELICKKVEPFQENDILQCVTREPEKLVLQVNNKNPGEFEAHRQILREHTARLPKEFPANWLLFSVIIRQLQKHEKAVLSYDDCVYIADKLFINKKDVENLLHDMYEDIGVLMYFPNNPVLSDIVICDPSVIFKCVSEMIITTFNDAVTDNDHKLFKKYGIFAYSSRIFTRPGDNAFKQETLIMLLQEIGAIAPIEYEPAKPPFECPLCKKDRNHARPKSGADRDDGDESLYHIHEKYILPCVLPDATDDELLEIEQKCLEKFSTVAPLVITFDGGYTPVGGLCYLFTNLVANQEKNMWIPNIPNKSGTEPDYRNKIYRNKFTIHCNGDFYVTLLSRGNCYKIFVESANEDPLEYKVYYQVWTAIKGTRDKCTNQVIKAFKPAFECTCEKSIEEKHFMEVDVSKQLKAICQKTKGNRKKKEIYPAKYSAWFKELKLIERPLKAVQLHKLGSDVSIKVMCTECGKGCSYSWEKNGSDDPESSCNYHIKKFCGDDQGTYSCTVTESENHLEEVVSIEHILDPFKEQPRVMEKEGQSCSTGDAQLGIKLHPCPADEEDYYRIQWYRDNKTECIRESEGYDGVDTPILTIKNLKQEHEGEYYCKVTVDGSSPISSKRAKFTIKQTPQMQDTTTQKRESNFNADQLEHPQPVTGVLTINDLKRVSEMVWDARVKWYEIGLNLDIPPGTLDATKSDCRDYCDKCFMEVLKMWLSRVQPHPTWEQLAEALRSPTVGYGDLANKVSQHTDK